MEESILTLLQSISILELRIVARQVGVAHPTVYTRAEILAAIIAISEGKMIPEFSVRGKPVKHTSINPALEAAVRSIQMSSRQNLKNVDEEYSENADENDGISFADSCVFMTNDEDLSQEGFYFQASNGSIGAYSEDFELLTNLESARVVENGTPVTFDKTPNTVKSKILAINNMACSTYEVPEPWQQRVSADGRKINLFGLPVHEGGVTQIRGEGARSVAMAVAAELVPDALYALDFAEQAPYEWDVSSADVFVGTARATSDDHVRFVAARVQYSATLGERVLLVASNVGKDTVEIWREATGSLLNGGSVTVLILSDEEQEADTVIETDGLGQLYPPIDFVRSDSKYFKGRDAELLALKQNVAGKTAEEAWLTVLKG